MEPTINIKKLKLSRNPEPSFVRWFLDTHLYDHSLRYVGKDITLEEDVSLYIPRFSESETQTEKEIRLSDIFTFIQHQTKAGRSKYIEVIKR